MKDIPPRQLLELYDHLAGKAWEPRDRESEPVMWLIGNGFVRRVDGRCGFEAFKDSMLEWTLAGQLAIKAIRASEREQAVAGQQS